MTHSDRPCGGGHAPCSVTLCNHRAPATPVIGVSYDRHKKCRGFYTDLTIMSTFFPCFFVKIFLPFWSCGFWPGLLRLKYDNTGERPQQRINRLSRGLGQRRNPVQQEYRPAVAGVRPGRVGSVVRKTASMIPHGGAA